MHANLSMRFRAAASFERALEILDKLPDGFFLWVHVMTPHHPYLPDPADRGRFLPYDEQRTFEEESESRWQPHYEPDQQSQVDRRRLLYDEFISTADRAFGSFMSKLEDSGKMRETTVIVSADHGESFEGGVFRHESPYQTRPVIHVPLIIRTPDQQVGRRVAFTADQTSLPPTILELVGQPKPDWMRGQSLVGWLNRDGQGQGEGRAFAQFLERNSVFRPLRHGTVGVIDGKSQCQYVLDLDTLKGSLRPLKEAHIWNLDRSAENSELAQVLRAAIYSRFPELPQEP
jgi:arylsulfatase A-like enzyme